MPGAKTDSSTRGTALQRFYVALLETDRHPDGRGVNSRVS
jgi:hypothetical protein